MVYNYVKQFSKSFNLTDSEVSAIRDAAKFTYSNIKDFTNTLKFSGKREVSSIDVETVANIVDGLRTIEPGKLNLNKKYVFILSSMISFYNILSPDNPNKEILLPIIKKLDGRFNIAAIIGISAAAVASTFALIIGIKYGKNKKALKNANEQLKNFNSKEAKLLEELLTNRDKYNAARTEFNKAHDADINTFLEASSATEEAGDAFRSILQNLMILCLIL